jgi:hypothetical protein
MKQGRWRLGALALLALGTFGTADSSACTGTAYIQADTGRIAEGFEEIYSPGLRCVWIIRTSAAAKLVVDVLETELGFDFVRVFEGEGPRARLLSALSGSASGRVLKPNATSFTVVFTSDSSVERAGFRASWSVATAWTAPKTGQQSVVLRRLTPTGPRNGPITTMVPTTLAPTVSAVNCGGTVRLASTSGVLASSRPNRTRYLPNRYICVAPRRASLACNLQLCTRVRMQ